LTIGWKLVLAVCLASLAVLPHPPISSAALTFGTDLSQIPGPGDRCTDCAAFTLKTTGGTDETGSPVNGTLISARVRTRYEGGIGTVRILRPTGGDLQFLDVAEAPLSVTADVSADGHITEIQTSIPIKIHDRLALSFPDQSLHYLKRGDAALCAWRPESPVQPIGTPATYFTDGCSTYEVLVAGTVEPDNSLSLGKWKSLKKGKVQLPVTVPNPGAVRAFDARFQAGEASAARKIAPQLKSTTATTGTPGTLALTLKPSKAGRRTLLRKGKLRVLVAVSFTPTGGTARTELIAVRFKTNR
jgi:hypothetical protein